MDDIQEQLDVERNRLQSQVSLLRHERMLLLRVILHMDF
ncbi:hypothetical protein LCGC14_2802440 [marine sediment metagenome]|uniref:Uncharacterized protein n=1 Tax=marine sediment metagenome TaxID=412755 RepID=A0A0F9AVT1_9ZZZZ